MQQSVVSMIIAFYIFVSTALLIFNVAYMLGGGVKKRITDRRVREEIKEQAKAAGDASYRAEPRYRRQLYRKLKNPGKLAVIANAAEENRGKISEDAIVECLHDCRTAVFDAAAVYRKKPAMERALFAYLISLFPDKAAEEHKTLGEILIDYLDDSTIYCRQNVLQALYRLGNEDALVRALKIFYEHRWYHNPKLIADGLTQFRGDTSRLARRLWSQKKDERMEVTLIQFMNRIPDDMSDLILPALFSKYHEARFAAVRYFANHINPEAEKVLLNILEEDSDVSAVAAQALGSYPGEKTKKELMHAIHSGNWYTRHNAAVSLVQMDLSPKEIENLCTSDDRYVREMFTYIVRKQRDIENDSSIGVRS